jgi:hypothetical protein
MNRRLVALFICVGTCFPQTAMGPRSGHNKTGVSKESGSPLNPLTQPSAAPVVPDPGRYDPAKIEAVNELHDYQIRDLIVKVSNLENTRMWIIGLTAGLGIGIALIIWLRKDIIRSLVAEAFFSGGSIDAGTPPRIWRPGRAQWIVLWSATVILSALCVFVPRSLSLSLRLGIIVVANAILLLFSLARR